MKFKAIFILFNIIILVTFLLMFFMPALLGLDLAFMIWDQNWYVPVLFILVIGILDVYVALHWKMFSLLEAEDWRGLKDWVVENRIKRGFLSSQFLLMYIKCALMLNELSGIDEVRQICEKRRPRLARKHRVILSISIVLRSNPGEMAERFRVEDIDAREPWYTWFASYALILDNKAHEARQHLVVLATSRGLEKSLSLLSLYFLKNLADTPEIEELLEKQLSDLKQRYTRQEFNARLKRETEPTLVLILTPFINSAIDWVYHSDKNAAASTGREAQISE